MFFSAKNLKAKNLKAVMTTSRAGGLHKPPWGISHAEPIGSSNDPPLAEVATATDVATIL